jgi:hypothetical protein
MKRARDLHSIISVAMHVICVVNPSGSISLVAWLSITSVEYMSLKELTQMERGIKLIVGVVVAMIFITSLMIYLANADQSLNNNTMMRT